MKPYLFYDTESTGYPRAKVAPADPEQPHMVGLGIVVVDLDEWRRLAQVELVIRPDGWEIPEESIAVHGITPELANAVGVEEHVAIGLLLSMAARCEKRVAFFESFDQKIANIAAHRYFTPLHARAFAEQPVECTLAVARPHVKIAPTEAMKKAGISAPKTPNLSEAYWALCGKKHEHAHLALADTLVNLELYWALTQPQAVRVAAARRNREEVAHG